MSKLYTITCPEAIMFLASEQPDGVELAQYVERNIDVNGIEVPVYTKPDTISVFDAELQRQNISWSLNFTSAVQQGNDLILTIPSENFYQTDFSMAVSCTPEELEVRLDILRLLKFQISESTV
jgi:hypothetical protein